MTTIVEGRLSEALQALVDARLDTIDRMLLGRVNRQDRLAIVREVESQIFDLLQGRDADSLDRDDVLAVLARLDPPEAYLPDESSTVDGRGPARLPSTPRPSLGSTGSDGRIALVSGVLGIVSVLMCFAAALSVLAEGFFESEPLAYIMIFGPIGVTFITGLLAVIMAARLRLRGGWSLVGFVTGTLSLLGAFFGGAGLLLMIAS